MLSQSQCSVQPCECFLLFTHFDRESLDSGQLFRDGFQSHRFIMSRPNRLSKMPEYRLWYFCLLISFSLLYAQLTLMNQLSSNVNIDTSALLMGLVSFMGRLPTCVQQLQTHFLILVPGILFNPEIVTQPVFLKPRRVWRIIFIESRRST